MRKERLLREYLLLSHGKMPNGDHICQTDGGSDQLHGSNGASLSSNSVLGPESGIPALAQTFVFVPFE